MSALALALLAPTVHAQSKPPGAAPEKTTDVDATSPEELAKRGKELGNEKKWQEALPLLQRAYEGKKSYDIAGNLGIVEHELGMYLEAIPHLREALRGFPVSGKPAHRGILEDKLDSALQHVVHLRLNVAPDGACVNVNGERVGCAPFSADVYVLPGRLQVRAFKDGFQEVTHDIDGRAGTVEPIRIQLAAPKAPAAPSAGEADNAEGFPLWPALTAGGLSVAGFVIGGVMWAVADGTIGDANALQDELAARTGRPRESACFGQTQPDVVSDCDELTSMRDSADQQRAGAIAGFVIGGAFAAAGIGLLVAHFVASPSDEASLVVAPMHGGASIHFVRRW